MSLQGIIDALPTVHSEAQCIFDDMYRSLQNRLQSSSEDPGSLVLSLITGSVLVAKTAQAKSWHELVSLYSRSVNEFSKSICTVV